MSATKLFRLLKLLALAALCTALTACGKQGPPAAVVVGINNGLAEPAPAKAAPPSRLTHANVDRVKVGLSAAEVRDILGSPETEALAGGGGNEQIWSWTEGNRSVMLTVAGGGVKAKTADGLDQEPARITRENLNKVKIGMAPDDVVALLGPAGGESEQESLHNVTWKDGAKLINVIFQGGKVSMKNGQGL
jgi:outer membrane protein assembly factor BamE (lipoprotein component of BamABCDE complex)